MIRDPSDGSVRATPKADLKPAGSSIGPDTGLRQPTRTDAQIRLERSREWLKSYFEEQQNARGNDGKEHSAGGDSGGQNARSTVE